MKINICITFLICFLTKIGYAQQYLIDSLQKILPRTTNSIQKVDVLIGLTRASLFAATYEAADTYAEQALRMARAHNYQPGIAAALLFKNQVIGVTHPEESFPYALQALKIAQKIKSKSIETFASYHVAEHYIYQKNNYKEGLKILSEMLSKIDKTVPDKHIGNLHKVMGIAYSRAGDEEKTFYHFEKALYHFERVKTHPFIEPDLGCPSYMDADGGELNKVQVLLYLSREYYKKAEHQKAIDLALTALEITKRLLVIDNEGWAYEELATNNVALGKYDKAIEYYKKALLIYEKNNSLYYLHGVVTELGSIFYRMKDWELAETYFQRALAINEKMPDTLGMIQSYSRLGQVALAKGEAESALKFHQKAAELNVILKDSTNLAHILANIGWVWQYQKKYEKALDYYQEALSLNQKYNNHIVVIDNFISISKIHCASEQLDAAKDYGLLALNLAKQYGSLDQRKRIQETLSIISEKLGDYQSALSYHKNYFQLHDSIFTKNAQALLKREEVSQNIADYQSEKEQAEREAALLSTQNQLYLIVALALLAILIIGSYLFLQLRKTQLQLKMKNEKLQQLNVTKDKFFGIIAHDIRSPIVALDGVGEQMAFYLTNQRTDKLERLAERVDKTAKQLSALLDNLLNWALLQQGNIPYRPQPICIQEVATQVLEMFQANADVKKIALKSEIAADLKVFADEGTLHTILRNLISNAIKFTLPRGTVTISTQLQDNKVFINVNDTGTGISTEKLAKIFSIEKKSEIGTAGEKGTGLGLMLVKEFVKLNKGNVTVESKMNEGSRFTVSLPIAA